VYPKNHASATSGHAIDPTLASKAVKLHYLSPMKVKPISPLGAETAPTATAENVPKAEVPPAQEAKPTPPVAEEQPAPPAPPEQPPSVAENKPPEVQQPPAPPAPAAQAPAPAPASPAPAPTEQPARRELPRTAGELPLIALIGALCLGAGLGLKVLSARS